MARKELEEASFSESSSNFIKVMIVGYTAVATWSQE
jgi:hypothetical protein